MTGRLLCLLSIREGKYDEPLVLESRGARLYKGVAAVLITRVQLCPNESRESVLTVKPPGAAGTRDNNAGFPGG